MVLKPVALGRYSNLRHLDIKHVCFRHKKQIRSIGSIRFLHL